MKNCSVCKEEKDFSFFNTSKTSVSGYKSACKDCTKIQKAESYQRTKEKHLKRCAEWQRNNKDKKNAINARYRNSHKESIAAHLKVYYEANKEKVAKRTSEWAKSNLGTTSANRRIDQARKINRVPAWLTESDLLRMKCYYQVAAMRTRESGQKWHVDHIIPLRGKEVSGLHVPNNLQVITAAENRKKRNLFSTI